MIETVEVGGRTFHTVVFTELAGEQFDIDALGEPRFRAWGEALGQLHAAMKAFSGRSNAARRSWRDDLAFVEDQTPVDAVEIRAEFDRLGTALNALPVDSSHVGLIHFDFELDNLIWRNGSFAMLDFDDSAHYWYAADIAFALRDLFDAGCTLDDRRVRAFLDGYGTHTEVDDMMVATIPTFSRLIRLLVCARIVRSLDLDPGPDYPDWLNGLITTFRNHARDYRESLKGGP